MPPSGSTKRPNIFEDVDLSEANTEPVAKIQKLEAVKPSPSDKKYEFFEAVARWLVKNGYSCTIDEMKTQARTKGSAILNEFVESEDCGC